MAWLRNRGMDMSIPDGRTVTPTDDVQILLHCADIWDKSYTTIAALLADTTTLLVVITDDNAIDYLVRSTTFASGVTADSTAMSYIGAYDYATYTLLADSTWRTAICNSSYYASVLNVSVPTMTSNTTPSGVCSASSVYSTSYPAWKAFDKDTSTTWYSTNTSTAWVQYQFTSAVKCCAFYIKPNNNSSSNFSLKDYKIQGSNDNSTFVDLYSGTVPSATSQDDIKDGFSNNTAYEYYRLFGATTYKTNYGVLEFDVYGRENGGVQTWLRSGGITNKSYTTLAEVLNDTATLTALLSSADAIDYLVTCIGWAETICADSSAMTYIGQNNYASNTLLADATWRSAICNSTYYTSVLNTSVPTMTSDTTPKGVASAQSYYTSGQPYKAFDKNTSTIWSLSPTTAAGSSKQAWVQYTFENALKVYVVTYSPRSLYPMTAYKIQASNDGVNFDDIASGTSFTRINILPAQTYSTWRLLITQKNGASNSAHVPNVAELDFYGRADV